MKVCEGEVSIIDLHNYIKMVRELRENHDIPIVHLEQLGLLWFF